MLVILFSAVAIGLGVGAWLFLSRRAEQTIEVRSAPPPRIAAPAASADGGPSGGCELVLIDPGRNKIAAIKRVREITGWGLKEAKDLVEGAPQRVAQGLTPEQAEVLRRAFESDGAQVEIR